MAGEAYYNTGTATVAANSKTVTGTGTNWLSAVGGLTAIKAGDKFGIHVGRPIIIASVDSNTQLTLEDNWPGPAQTNAAYKIELTNPDVIAVEAMRRLLGSLGSGVLYGLSQLPSTPSKALTIDENGSAALADLSPLGRSLIASLNSSAAYGALGAIPNAQLPTRLRELSTAVTDADVAVTTGSYAVTSTALNIPEGGAGVLTVDMFSSNSGAVQIYTRLSNGNMWVRVRNAGAWGAWARVPTFGSDNIIPEASLPARARAASSSVTNIDTAVDSGDYTTAGTATGHPTGSGVFGFSTVYVNSTTQIQIGSTAGNAWYVRAKSSGTWGSWSRLPLAQTSVTDTTANAAMIVGAFGLGANSITLSSTDNLDALTASSGMYNWGSPSPTNAPYTFGVLLNIRRNSTTGVQVVWNHGTGSPQYRYQGSGTWSAWISFGGDVSGPAAATDGHLAAFNGTTGKLLKPQALSAFAATILDDTSGAAMFATMGATFSGNATAGSAKFPNGLELKWGTSTNSLSDYRLLFPIAFANGCFVALPINTFDYGGATDRFIGVSTSNVDKNGFDIRARNITNGGGVAGQGNVPVRWLAVGW
ncbi:pyocin knob domain-containing protein [Agrobacterium pusense]|uniref:pyocin knob domain-containing protein n=1 Tax=Agrobacterium pusense TaxID=648995 RepID=UPI00068E55C8|nr:pyocin knob domain-containing protein [Agrobacterium pusense]ANV25021.1 hypothetical protein BA939_14460 [Rhizobium sp. S41]QWW74175.1 pyocin knob domain-containing protein [Agrobacterium pusense]